MNYPVPRTQQDLIAYLADILDRVKTGDSMEGSIEWTLPGEGDPQDAYAMVRASYRIGNLQGQGGMRMVGAIDPPSPVAERGCDACSSEPGEAHGGGCRAVAGGAA